LSGANDPGFLTELFSGFGPIAVRRMFSGAGVFADWADDRVGGRRRDLPQSDDSFVPLFVAGRADAIQLQDPGRQAHAEFVLADAGATLRRAR
jgi:DNA transformation protein